MANSFASLKKSRSNDLQKLQSEVEKINNPQNNFSREDDRFWKAELDKSGNGYAVIRFLPPPNGEEMAWAKIFNHGFQGPGGWYIENSLTTIGQKDPLAEYNSTLWNSGIEANKEIARKQKRRLTYISNIFVVEDKANPQNEDALHFLGILVFQLGQYDTASDLICQAIKLNPKQSSFFDSLGTVLKAQRDTDVQLRVALEGMGELVKEEFFL